MFSLAMAEMTTLMAGIYQSYSTSVKADQLDVSPGITSRFEVFYDETYDKMEVSIMILPTSMILTYLKEHTCWIEFSKL